LSKEEKEGSVQENNTLVAHGSLGVFGEKENAFFWRVREYEKKKKETRLTAFEVTV